MNTSKILAAMAIACTVAITSCKDETYDPHLKEGANGYLSTAKMTIDVTNGETEMRSSRATNVDNFVVSVLKGNTITKKSTYGELESTIELEASNDYKVSVVSSEECPLAEFDAPYFKGEQAFEIEADKVTEVDPVVCKLANVKVSIKYSDALKQALGDDVTVTVRASTDGELVYTPDETRSGYFRYVDNSFTMVVTLSGTIAGDKETVTQYFKDFAPGQHRIITFGLKGPDGNIPDETGTISGEGVSIDVSYTTQDLTVPVKPGDDADLGNDGRPGQDDNTGDNKPGEDDPQPPTPGDEEVITFSSDNLKLDGSVTSCANDLFIPDGNGGYQTDEDGFYLSKPAVVNIKADNGIAELLVTIESEGLSPAVLGGVGLPNVFDLVNPTYPNDYEGSRMDSLGDAIGGLGLPWGSDVKDKTAVDFDITGFMGLLTIYGGDSTFLLKVTDNSGNSKTLKLIINADVE